MTWPLVWRSRHEDELADAKADANRLRKRAEEAEAIARTEVANRRTIAGQYSELFDRHERLVRGNRALAKQLESAQVGSGFDAASARRTADRIARLQRAVARARTEATSERRRGGQLQSRLDDALGLHTAAIEEGARWQQRRPDKPTVKGLAS